MAARKGMSDLPILVLSENSVEVADLRDFFEHEGLGPVVSLTRDADALNALAAGVEGYRLVVLGFGQLHESGRTGTRILAESGTPFVIIDGPAALSVPGAGMTLSRPFTSDDISKAIAAFGLGPDRHA